MPRRIAEPDCIIQGIAVPIQALRIARLRYDRICGQEPPDSRIIPPGVVEQQTAAAVLALTGEAALRRRCAEAVAALTPRPVTQLGGACAALVGRDAGRAEVIGRQPAYYAVDPQRNALTVRDISH